VDFGVEQRAMS